MVPHKSKDIIQLILIIVVIFMMSYIIHYTCALIFTKKQSLLLNNIQDSTISKQNTEVEEINFENTESINEDTNNQNIQPIEKTERMLQIETLQNENSEIKGWIEIEKTAINYPVLQGTDNEFYVNHNYNKVKTKSGSIFIDMAYDWKKSSTNMLIYGHNMKNGTMFTSLMNYKNKSYYEDHKNIRFTTNNIDTTYEIISAFESKVYNDDENVFKYYNFINANNEDEFNEFITNIKKLSIYNTEKTAKYGDELMTLSTCAYHTKNGRFVVIAKKVK